MLRFTLFWLGSTALNIAASCVRKGARITQYCSAALIAPRVWLYGFDIPLQHHAGCGALAAILEVIKIISRVLGRARGGEIALFGEKS